MMNEQTVSDAGAWIAAWPGYRPRCILCTEWPAMKDNDVCSSCLEYIEPNATLSQLDPCPDMDLDPATPQEETSQADYEFIDEIPADPLPSAF